ncbi:MAG: cupin domain-containing protein [bacterium]|nr:cupin domain-containing protein [bacterium]
MVVKIGLVTVIIVSLYFGGGYVIHSLFPEKQPDLNGYFKPGDRLVSRYEGFDQTALAVDGEWLHTRLEVAPLAGGPPEHFHEHFAETFTVKSGTLSILVDGEKKTLKAGESITIPPMTRHKPFNETNETVIVESDDPKTIPMKFAYILSQLYGFMDTYPAGPSVPEMVMQLSTYGNEADSWLADGPPLSVQKAMRVALAPTARLMGYSNHYEQFGPKR